MSMTRRSVLLAILCVFCFVSSVHARKKPKPGQPGFKYNGPHGDHSSSSDLFSEGKVWIFVTVVASVLAFAAMICSPCCWKFLRKKQDVLCHLCHNKVSARSWSDGSHRTTCSEAHGEWLQNLPAPCDIFCPQCGLKLKLWPVQDHAKFKCHSKQCVHHKAGHELVNDGSNRFSCYIHDYDLCGKCVMANLKAKQNDNHKKTEDEDSRGSPV